MDRKTPARLLVSAGFVLLAGMAGRMGWFGEWLVSLTWIVGGLLFIVVLALLMFGVPLLLLFGVSWLLLRVTDWIWPPPQNAGARLENPRR